MSLQDKIMDGIKTAMKAKDKVTLESLRAVKSVLLLEQTNGSGTELTEADEIKILQRLVKQRKDSAAIYLEQGREDLATPELEQAKVIESFLPQQLSEEEVTAVIQKIVSDNSLEGMASMGKVMGLATAQLAGQSDGKTISAIVKKVLSN
ncbi:MAG: GatB/YqeY domain-containing protein [Flavobacteriales bacterium]|nr:GatB/YqeY domain-containing protein [Flavobacteriales bacterium]